MQGQEKKEKKKQKKRLNLVVVSINHSFRSFQPAFFVDTE